MAANLEVLAGDHPVDRRTETGERGTDAATAAHGVWDHAARLAQACALSPYRRRAVECLFLRPGDTVVDLGCSSAAELDHLQRAVGDCGKVLVLESEERPLERLRRWICRHRWTNVHLVHANLGEFQFPAEIGGILIAGTVARVGDLDTFARKAAAALRSGGRLVVLDFNLVRPRWLHPSDEPPGTAAGRGSPLPLDLHLWKVVSSHLAPALFRQRLFGAVFVVAGESR